MDNEETIHLMPGVYLTINTNHFTVEQSLALGSFHAGSDIKVYVDVRLVDVISKEQSKAESLVILRTK